MLVDKQRAEAYLPEQRYPLPLSSAMPDVWELWQRAKTLEWDPQTDIPWEDLHPERYSAEQLLAAQMYWSRRTWGEYGAISESPALLLRFCLEIGRASCRERVETSVGDVYVRRKAIQ